MYLLHSVNHLPLKASCVYSSCSLRKLLLVGSFFFVGVAACSAQGPKGAPMASGLSQYYWASSPSYSLDVVQVLLYGLCSWLLELLILSFFYLLWELMVLLFIVFLLVVSWFLLLCLLALALWVPLLGEDLPLLVLAHIHGHLYPSLLLVAFLSCQ